MTAPDFAQDLAAIERVVCVLSSLPESAEETPKEVSDAIHAVLVKHLRAMIAPAAPAQAGSKKPSEPPKTAEQPTVPISSQQA